VGPLLIFITVGAINFKFGIQLGFGEYLTEKQLLGPKSTGLEEHPNKFWDPLLTFATIEARNFKLGTHQEQLSGPESTGVWARAASKNCGTPLLISAAVEASNFKFGMQLGFGSSLPRNNF